ncbi:MAG: hypothetical protein RQ801_06790, partial [Spirochaetaceae bacterium]|nr:hypothetical protein [Spirochaetaceae bacterium]
MKKAIIALILVGILGGCATFESVMSTMTESMVDSVALAPELDFAVLYASYVVLGGGYLSEEDNFPVGTGVTWKIINSENQEEVEMTRAKLNPGGAGAFWWSLNLLSDGQEKYYEFLLDKDDVILKVRYRDSENGSVAEFVPDPVEEEDEESLPGDYSDFIVGKERITTPAGTFNTEKMFFDDPENSYTATYWLAKSVPGNTVRYAYEDPDEGENLTGELV